MSPHGARYVATNLLLRRTIKPGALADIELLEVFELLLMADGALAHS
jgi:hypothetical protein